MIIKFIKSFVQPIAIVFLGNPVGLYRQEFNGKLLVNRLCKSNVRKSYETRSCARKRTV